MSDWSMYEDTTWEEFSRSDDHIVPLLRGEDAHESIGQDDFCRKQQKEEEAAITREDDEPMMFLKEDRISNEHSMAYRTVKAGPSWHQELNPQGTSVDSDFASHETKIFDGTFTNHQIDINDNISCRYAIIGNVGVGSSNASEMCNSSPADVFSEDKEPQLLQCVKNSDILDYEWVDINNFDKMLRNCGNAFAQGSVGSADELSWFSSSSQMIDESEDTFNFCINSSNSEFGSLTKLSIHNENCPGFLLEDDSLTEDHLLSSLNYCANSKWLDSNAEVSESMLPNEMKVPAVAQNSNSKDPDMDSNQTNLATTETTERTKSGLSESETRNGFHTHYSDTMQSLQRENALPQASSSLETCPFPLMCHQSLCPTVSYNRSNSFDYFKKIDNGPVTWQTADKMSVACAKSEVRSNTSPAGEVSVDITSHETHDRQDTHTNKVTDGRQSDCPGWSEAELEEPDIQYPKLEKECVTIEENSMRNAFSDDISPGSSSFRELQDVLDQLDIRTKLCIRDGLYRLARNAEMRHCVDSIKHARAMSGNSCRSPRMDTSRQCSELMLETGTNLIDRSIAHLLFYRASDSSSGPTNHDVSHESHITNEQNRGTRPMPSNA